MKFRTDVLMPITHAVRYIQVQTPWQTVEEARAIGDIPDVSTDEFSMARINLLSALRAGHITLWSRLILKAVKNSPEEVQNAALAINSDTIWHHYVEEEQTSGNLKEVLPGTKSYLPSDLNKLIPVPRSEIRSERIDWKDFRFRYRGMLFEVDGDNCAVSPDHVEPLCDHSTTDHNQKLADDSISKLLVAMSRNKYGYSPDKTARDRNSLTKIMDDLDLEGLSIDRGTIKKHLDRAFNRFSQTSDQVRSDT